jgi:hypothetical protein
MNFKGRGSDRGLYSYPSAYVTVAVFCERGKYCHIFPLSHKRQTQNQQPDLKETERRKKKKKKHDHPHQNNNNNK